MSIDKSLPSESYTNRIKIPIANNEEKSIEQLMKI